MILGQPFRVLLKWGKTDRLFLLLCRPAIRRRLLQEAGVSSGKAAAFRKECKRTEAKGRLPAALREAEAHQS